MSYTCSLSCSRSKRIVGLRNPQPTEQLTFLVVLTKYLAEATYEGFVLAPGLGEDTVLSRKARLQ